MGLHPDFVKLRHKFDGSEGFMHSHQINKKRTRSRTVPAWALDDKKVQSLLLRAFPKLKTDPRQTVRAGRWARVIYLCFRLNLTESEAARDMGLTHPMVSSIIRSMTRVSKGLRADTRGPRAK